MNAKKKVGAAPDASIIDDDKEPCPAAPCGPRLLSKFEVVLRTKTSFPTLWQWMRDGRFPRARDLNGKTVWLETEVDEFLESLPPKTYLGDPQHQPNPGHRLSPGRRRKEFA